MGSNHDSPLPQSAEPVFGSFLPGNSARGGAGGSGLQPGRGGEGSIVDEHARPGASNISAGVVRRKKRTIKGLQSANVNGMVAKNYRTSDAVMFNNVDELFQDKISREFAQEIVEDLFDKCGVDTSDPQAAKYAEDALFMFMIATTASNKADYDKQITIPSKNGGGTELDMQVFSNLLASTYGVTRREFARGVADDMRKLLRHDENTHLLPVLATRVGCDPQFSHLAFDGSTHCTGMTTREIGFTKTLEARNLFETDDVLAAGASDSLMQGMPAGVRSVVPR
jgi:hypothetical protein